MLDWDLEELEPVLGSVQPDNWVQSNGDARGYSLYASLHGYESYKLNPVLHPARALAAGCFVVGCLLLLR